jgi:hypothetical protein
MLSRTHSSYLRCDHCHLTNYEVVAVVPLAVHLHFVMRHTERGPWKAQSGDGRKLGSSLACNFESMAATAGEGFSAGCALASKLLRWSVDRM